MSNGEEAVELEHPTYVAPSAPPHNGEVSNSDEEESGIVETLLDGSDDDVERESSPLNAPQSTLTEVSPDLADGSSSPFVPELTEDRSPPPGYVPLSPVRRRTLPPIRGLPGRSPARTTEDPLQAHAVDEQESHELQAVASRGGGSPDSREGARSQTSERLPGYDEVMGKTRETTFTHSSPPPYLAVAPTRLHVSGDIQSVNTAYLNDSYTVYNPAGNTENGAGNTEQSERTQRDTELTGRQQAAGDPPPYCSCMPVLAERMGCTDRYERIVDTLIQSTTLKIFILFVIITLLAVILFPIQFSYIPYYQWGLAVRKSTGRVDTNKTYEFGCYILGADKEFIYLPRSIQSISYTNLDMFTSDNVAVSINAQFFYSIRYDGVGKIYEKYRHGYHDVIVKTAKSTIRNCAPRVIQLDYLYNRSGIEQLIHGAIIEKFADFGIDVSYFNVLDVYLPAAVQQLRLEKLLISVQTEQLIAERDAKLIQLETDRQVQQITLQAAEVTNNATYRAKVTTMLAGVDKRNLLEAQHALAFNNLTERVGVTTEEHAMSYFYLATLRTHPNYRGSIGYDQLMKFAHG